MNFFSDKYLEKFQNLCGLAADSPSIPIDTLRQIILFRSNGLCPASMIVSIQDGSFLTAKQMCNEDTYAFVKRKSVFKTDNLEQFAQKARHTEANLMSTREIKCAITTSQIRLVEDFVEKYKDDCKGFRKSLLDSSALNIVAIHVCRWDGSPRRSMAEIRDAICLYPSTPEQMKAFLSPFLKKMLRLTGVVVGLGLLYQVHKTLLKRHGVQEYNKGFLVGEDNAYDILRYDNPRHKLKSD